MASDAGAGSNQAPRKTLDDIRRELDAEYPASTPDAHPNEPEGAPTRVPETPYLDEDGGAMERRRPASRRRGRRRGYAMAAALGGIAGLVLLGVSYVRVAPETIRPAAVVSAPEVPPDEHRGIDARGPDPAAAVLSPALLTELDQQLKALRSDLQALAARLERSDSRIAGMASRVRGVESSMRRLADDVASAAATRAAERTVAASQQTAGKPVPVAPLPPAPTPVTVADAGRWVSDEHSAPESSPTPDDVRPVAEAAVTPPQPRTESTATTGVAPSRAARAVSDNPSRSSVPPTLRDKLRADWRTIKQGFASAGDDFKATMRDFARKVRGE